MIPATRISVLILFILCCVTPSNAQLDKLLAFEKTTNAKVEVGMSTEEVKKALGRPKAIEGGFPNADELIISGMPEQAGQLNNSTWFYFFKQITVNVDDPTYKVNGFPVSEEDYVAYLRLNEVYIYKGQVIHPRMADSYKVLQDPKLIIVSKNTATTYKNSKPKKVRQSYTPVYCVIFDRGTQVVASTKMFFMAVTPM